MELIKTLIVDDESAARALLKNMVKEIGKPWEVVAEVDSVKNALSAIDFHRPDLVLLDIELSDGSGFDLLDAIPDPQFHVIFVTGYDQHAIRAFRYSALDYLLKPVSRALLAEALQKVKSLASSDPLRVQRLKENLRQREEPPSQIAIPHGTGYSFISLKDVVMISASGNCVYFHMTDGNRYLATHSLGYYEEFLPEEIFFRAHKSHIVNLKHVKKYEAARGGHLLLSNGMKAEVAQRRKTLLLDYLRGLSQ